MTKNDYASLAQRLREGVRNPHHVDTLSDGFRSLVDEAINALGDLSGTDGQEYEIAGYEGSFGLYYSRLAAVANGEQSVEPVYRVKK